MNTESNTSPQQKEIGEGKKMKNRKELKEISQSFIVFTLKRKG